MSEAMRQRKNSTAAICKYVNSGQNLQPSRNWDLQPNMRRCGRGVGKYSPHPLVIFRTIGRSATGEALLEAVTETMRKHALHFEVFWCNFASILTSFFVKSP